MNFAQENKTSVRVAQTPGGSSSLNLGWDTQCEQVRHKRVDRNQSSFSFNDGSNEPLVEKKFNVAKCVQAPTKVVQNVGGTQTFSFQEEPMSAKTSVRVRAPPGGKSNIVFG